MFRFLQCFFVALSFLCGFSKSDEAAEDQSYRFDQPLKNITKYEQANYTFAILDGNEGDYFLPVWIVNGVGICNNGEAEEGSYFSVTAGCKTLTIYGNLAPTDRIDIEFLINKHTDMPSYLNFTHTLFILRSKPEEVLVDCNETNFSSINCKFSRDYDTYGLKSVYNVSVYDSNAMESPVYNEVSEKDKLALNVNLTESEGVYKVLVKLIVNGVNSKMESNITTVTVKMKNLEVDEFESYVTSSHVATVGASPSIKITKAIIDQTGLISIESAVIIISITAIIAIILILSIVFLVAIKIKKEKDKNEMAKHDSGTHL